MPEAAGIARAKVKDICDGQAEDFDALIVSGGFGAAKNLSDFAVNGSAMAVHDSASGLFKLCPVEEAKLDMENKFADHACLCVGWLCRRCLS